MMSDRRTWTRWLAAGAALVMLALLGAAALPAEAGAGAISEKLERQIKVMEEVIDEVLVDSPHILVFSSDPTQGVYLDEFGAVFMFQASLVGRGGALPGLDFLDQLHIETSEDGKTIVWFGEEGGERKIEIIKEGGEDEDEDDDEDENTREALAEAKREAELKYKEALSDMGGDSGLSEEELYAKGKAELIEGLVDYGATLTGLRDDQWVAITAFLQNAKLFERNEISRLVLKVRVRDLRAQDNDQITRDVLASRVVVEEY